MMRWILPALVALPLVASCGSESAPPLIASAPTPVAAPTESSPAVATVGLPPIDRPWTSADYEAAATALEATDKAKLPTAPSSTFLRIVARENFDLYADRSQPASSRMIGETSQLRSLMHILKVYLDNSERGQRFIRERYLIDFASLHSTVIVWQNLDELLKGLDPKDPSYPERMATLDRMQHENARQVQHYLVGLDPEEERDTVIWYASGLEKDLPSLFARSSAADRERAEKRLRDLIAAHHDAACKAAISRLLDALVKKP